MAKANKLRARNKTPRAGKKRAKRPGSTERTRAEASALKSALRQAAGGKRRSLGKDRVARQQLSAKERTQLSGVVIYLDVEARKQLARLAIDEERTIQDLGAEAINLLFQLYEVRPIA